MMEDDDSPTILNIIFIFSIFLLLILQFFAFFNVVGASMQPTLRDKDVMIVSKSFMDISRTDIVVFEGERYGISSDLVKRVIGLPGERIVIENGAVYINGIPYIEPYLERGTLTYGNIDIVVKKGTFWLLGDNRDYSTDSRDLGLIDKNDIIAKMKGVI